MSEKIIYIRDWEREVDRFADTLEEGSEVRYRFVKWASEAQHMLDLKVYEP